jgi:serine/threonine protein phosphatase PrpC
MQPFEISISQQTVSDAVPVESGTCIAVFEPHDPLASTAIRGRLIILLEPLGPAARARSAAETAVQALRRTFFESDAISSQSALRVAVITANKAVYRLNMGLPEAQRVTLGLTAAVLVGQDLFVAQVQPAQLYTESNGQLRALPSHPSWDPAHVSVAYFSHSGALGASLFVEPELYRVTLQPYESAIFCSSVLAPLLDRQTAARILRSDSSAAAAALLTEFALERQIRDLDVIVVQLRPAPARQATAAAPRSNGDAPRGFARLFRRPTEPQSSAETRPDPLFTLPDEPAASANPPPRPAPIDLGESLETRSRKLRESRNEQADLPPRPPRRPIDLGDTPLFNAAPPYAPRRPLRPIDEMSFTERLLLPIRDLIDNLTDFQRSRRARRHLPAAIQRVETGSSRRNQPPFPWITFLTTNLIVGILIIVGLSLSSPNDLQQQAIDYLQVAESSVTDVVNAQDEISAAAALELAATAIEAMRASPEITVTNPALWLRAGEVERNYERVQSALLRMTYFDEPTLITTHPQPNGSFVSIVVPPAALNVTDTVTLEALRYIYLVDNDRESPPIYRAPRDGGSAQTYLKPGDIVGNAVIGPVRNALWRIDQVVAIDEAANGFSYFFRQDSTWNYATLGGSESWVPRDRIDIEEFAGNLYVWGAQPGEILKYTSGRYSDTPEYWLNPEAIRTVGLDRAVDMSIDGSIYLLRPDGTILVFSFGQLVRQIEPTGVNPPIQSVTRMIVTGPTDSGAIFLLDPANQRVLQIDKLSGELIQQIRVRNDSEFQLTELTSMAFDSFGVQPLLYLANGNQVLRVELPTPPRNFRDELEDLGR